MKFFIGLHQPADSQHFERCFVSINRIRDRRSSFPARKWIMDSGAFTEISTHGGYREEPEAYAAHINRWHAQSGGAMVAAVSQDYMCEPFILGITGLTVADHQRLSIERYDRIRAAVPDAYVMPVLQGYTPAEYVDHIRQYDARLAPGMWIGVGSVCKRNGNPSAIEAVLLAVHRERPDLRLHGFGLKKTALGSGLVRQLLESADSMAWSYHARRQGRNANDPREALRYLEAVESQPVQLDLRAWMTDHDPMKRPPNATVSLRARPLPAVRPFPPSRLAMRPPSMPSKPDAGRLESRPFLRHTPSVSSVLRCQDRRCSKVFYGARLRPGDVIFPKCWAERCGRRWWAMKLGNGNAVTQLAKEFSIEALDVAERYGIPLTITTGPLYLQVELTGHEVEVYERERRSALWMFRALDLLPRNAA